MAVAASAKEPKTLGVTALHCIGLRASVHIMVQVSSIRISQFNAAVGLILVTPLPFVRSVMQKKRNVTHGSLRDGDHNSENENKRSAAM